LNEKVEVNEVINRIEKNTLYRSIVHVSSLIFLFVFLFIFTHQQMWIKGIMQHYFEVNIRSLLLFFFSQRSLSDIERLSAADGDGDGGINRC